MRQATTETLPTQDSGFSIVPHPSRRHLAADFEHRLNAAELGRVEPSETPHLPPVDRMAAFVLQESTYIGRNDQARDLLAAFSATDHRTSEALSGPEVDRALFRLLVRLSALLSLHGRDIPGQVLQTVPGRGSGEVFACVSHALDTGETTPSGERGGLRELQQELVHFSRIVDVGHAGFPGQGVHTDKRMRNSSRIPESLKTLTELMVVARGRVLQRGGVLPAVVRRRPRNARTEPADGVIVQAPSGPADHVLVITGDKRRPTIQAAYYLDFLLSYLPPGEAFTVLTASLAESCPSHDMAMSLAVARDGGVDVLDWNYSARSLPDDPYAAALRVLPRVVAPTGSRVPVGAGDRFLWWELGDGRISLVSGAGEQPRTLSVRSLRCPQEGPVDRAAVVRRAIGLVGQQLAGQAVRSIECGHIHLDRDLDVDQELGADIGAAVHAALARGQARPPLLTPMMDDDHVLVRLRPSDYADFLTKRLQSDDFHLIPESSPIVRGIAVALYGRMARSEQRNRLAVRGSNLFLRLADGTFCELFEDFEGASVSGCVLFETALLVYRSAPETFDELVRDRFGMGPHVHISAARILDGDRPHDVKAAELTDLYRPFASMTDPKRPDPEFTAYTEKVVDRLHGVAHLNVLEDYYEVQQGKVRQLLNAAGVPLRLVTVHFNAQTGRVAVEG